MKSNLAIFLDRDGVLIEDMDLLINANQIHVMPGVPAALQDLKRAGQKSSFRIVASTRRASSNIVAN